MSDEKGTPFQREQAYKQGREDVSDILGTDNDGEREAREKGLQDRVNAEQTRKEAEESEERKSDD